MTSRSVWAAAAVVAAVVLLVIVLVLNPFSGTPAGSGTSGALFGAFVQPGPRTGSDRRAAVSSFGSLIGPPLAMERAQPTSSRRTGTSTTSSKRTASPTSRTPGR
jgi:hypothetical protein